MAHNPSYVGKTHVVSVHDGVDNTHEVIGVHGNYGAARNQVDKHFGGEPHVRVSHSPGDVGYYDKNYDHNEPGVYFHIHREDGPGKFIKV